MHRQSLLAVNRQGRVKCTNTCFAKKRQKPLSRTTFHCTSGTIHSTRHKKHYSMKVYHVNESIPYYGLKEGQASYRSLRPRLASGASCRQAKPRTAEERPIHGCRISGDTGETKCSFWEERAKGQDRHWVGWVGCAG